MKTEAKMTQDYLNSGGNNCPYCGSTNINGFEADFDDTSAWRDIECKSCNQTWTELFMMTDIDFHFSDDSEERRDFGNDDE